MKIHTIRAKNAKLAHQKVKELLGDEAMILASHKIEDGFELVAGIDNNVNTVEERATKLANHSLSSEELATASSKNSLASNQPSLTNNQPSLASTHDLAQQLQLLNQQINEQLAALAWQQNERIQPLEAKYLNYLYHLGLADHLNAKLAKHLSSKLKTDCDCDQVLSEYLLKNLSYEDIIITIWRQLQQTQAYLLIGAQGSGKTLTLLKILKQLLADNLATKLTDEPNKQLNIKLQQASLAAKIAVISIQDSYHLATDLNFQQYASIFKIAHYQVKDLAELQLLWPDQLNNYALIFIDPPGWTSLSKNYQQYLSSLTAIQPLLILEATSSYTSLQAIWQQLVASKLTPNNILLTKCELAPEFSNILSFWLEQPQLQLSYITKQSQILNNDYTLKWPDLVLQFCQPGPTKIPLPQLPAASQQQPGQKALTETQSQTENKSRSPDQTDNKSRSPAQIQLQSKQALARRLWALKSTILS